MKEVTLVVTSCNRFDLLVQTLKSFNAMNTYPIAKMIIHEDSGDQTCIRRIQARYGDSCIFIAQTDRQGYSKALDCALSMVQTDYVFTTEDDWLYQKNPGFIERSMQILERNPNIHQVWIREHKDHNHPLSRTRVLNGIQVRDVIPGYRRFWNGFSLNPGLRRMSDLRRMFPNGLREFGDEIECAKQTAKFNYKAVSLEHATIVHGGWGRHCENFKV